MYIKPPVNQVFSSIWLKIPNATYSTDKNATYSTIPFVARIRCYHRTKKNSML